MVAKELIKNKRRLITLIGFSAVLITIMAVSLVNTKIKNARSEIANSLNTISQLKENQIKDWISEREADLLTFADNPLITKSIGDLATNPIDPAAFHAIDQSFSLVKNNYDYANILITYPDGKILYSCEMDSDFISEETQLFVNEMIEGSSKVSFGFYFCDWHQSTHLDFFTQISTPDASEFVVIYRINPESFFYPYIQLWPDESKTAETLVVKPDQDSVRFLNELRHQKNTAFKLAFPLSQLDLPASKAVMGYEGFFEGKDYRNERVISYIRPIRGTPWFLITKIDRQEAYAQVTIWIIWMGLFFVALVFFTAAGFNWIYSQSQKRLYQKLFSAEKDLNTSLQEFQTILYSIGDGVITTDTQGNIQKMNSVAEKLTGWLENEAYGKSLESVFNIINETTRETVVNPVEKVLESGLVIGLANHTLLISKSGEEIPITDSGAPIIDKNGKTCGVVLVFRDQLLERKATFELTEAKRKYENLFNSTLDGICLHEMIFDENKLAVDYRILDVNSQYEVILDFKKEDVIDKLASEVYGEPAYLDKYAEVVKTGNSVVFEGFYAPLQKHFHISAFCPAPGLFATAFKDVTQRVKSENDLKKIEWMLHPSDATKLTPQEGNGKSAPRINLVDINTNGLIFNSLGKDLLTEITGDYMHLLGTSSTIHEKDGSYAFGMFISGWCRFLDQSSRSLVQTDADDTAMASEHWLCHDTCWNKASLRAIETGQEIDIQCPGGLNLYALPIFANHAVIGAINFGYGDPPKDESRLIEIARDYRVDLNELKTLADQYETRPPFIIDLAKDRLKSSARMIGTLVELKLIHDQLMVSERRFKLLFDKAPLGYQSLDADGNFIDVNDAWLQTLGYQADEVIGKWFGDFIIKDLVPAFTERFPYFKNRGEIQTEFDMVHKNGSIIKVAFDGRIGYDSEGNFKQTHCLIQDITERRKMEEELNSERQKLRTILETIPDQIYYKDLQGRFIHCNTPVAKNIGYESPDEIIGKTDFDLFPKEYASQYWEDEKRIIETGIPLINHIEPLILKESGERIWNLTTKIPIKNHLGQPVGIIGINRDITERQKMVDDLVKAMKKAEEVNRFKSTLLSNLSHEIRTPLNGILGFAELLNEELEGNQAKQMSEIIYSSGLRLLNTLNGILDLSLVEAEQDKIHIEKVNLNKMADDSMRLFIAMALKKNLSINFIPSSKTVFALADEQLTNKILNNLINNALKFTKVGGVTIQVEQKELQQHDWACISISDTGIGIKEKDLALIFEEFRQVSEGSNRSFEGTGLGLHISRRFAELMGGHIEVTSKIGEGSKFTLCLPLTN